jgi:hypothetical protein
MLLLPRSSTGRRQEAPRTAPAAPRSAGSSRGRARSPPDQRIEHKFEGGSGTLRSPTGPLRVWGGRAGSQLSRTWAATQDSRGGTNLESAAVLSDPLGLQRSPGQMAFPPVLSRLLPVCCLAAWHYCRSGEVAHLSRVGQISPTKATSAGAGRPRWPKPRCWPARSAAQRSPAATMVSRSGMST